MAVIIGRETMQRPRITIAWIMTIVVAAAIDLVAIRWVDETDSLIGRLLMIGSIPMASVLVLGLPSLIRGITRRGKRRPFLVGFETVGWTVVLFYTGGAILFPESVATAIDLAGDSLIRPTGLEDHAARRSFVLCLAVLMLLLPQLVAAFVGGWLNQRFKIRIVVERRQVTGLETVIPCERPRPVSVRGANCDPASV